MSQRPDPIVPCTIPGLIAEASRAHGDREFLVMGDRRVTFRQADQESAELAKGLLVLGIGKGARVGLLLPNCPDWAIDYLAIGRAGGFAVLLSTFFQPPELAWGLRHNDIEILIVAARYLNHDYVERLESAVPGLAQQRSSDLYLRDYPYLRHIIVIGDCDRPWAMKGHESLRQAAARQPQIDDAFLASIEENIVPADWLVAICTSGTTAEPKSVVHTHGNVVRTVSLFNHYLGMRPSDRTYTGHALFWIGGQTANLLPAMLVGAALHFCETPTPADIAALVAREKLTRLNMWPAQAAAFLDHATAIGLDLSSVREGIGPPRDCSGAIVPPDRRMATTGGMGMTETFGPHTVEHNGNPTPPGKGNNFGRHIPGMERKVVDPETGAEVPPGTKGELFLRGASLMVGYYRREREEVFEPDGYFATGDMVVIDRDDYLYFHGRLSEMIKTAGANVSPREVELALIAHEDVREAIVFGMPDPLKGEIVVAVIVAQEGREVAAEALCDHLRDRISAYKIPKTFVLMPFEAIPRTASQKPRKPELKRMLAESVQI